MKNYHFIIRALSISITLALGLFFVILLIADQSGTVQDSEDQFSSAIDNWTAADGETYDLTALPVGEIEVTKDISELSKPDMRFCTKTIDTYFDVYADGQMVYSYQKNMPDIAGKSYGMNIHMVPLPSGTKELRLVLTPAFEGEKAILSGTVIAVPEAYMKQIFMNELPNFCICVVMLIIGLTTITIGMVGKMKREFITLGLLACITPLWSVNDTLLLQVMTQRPEIIRSMSYICFALMPFPPLAFISRISGNKHEMPVTIMTIVIVLNTVGVVILNATGICDYHVSVHMTRFIILIAMLMSLFFVFNALRKGMLKIQLLITLSVGVAFFAAGAIIDLLRNALSDSAISGSGFYTRLGIFIFLLVFVFYIISDYNRVLIENSNAEMMRKLAYTDALTGLNNRLAFNEKESHLKSTEQGNCIIIQLDINNLKLVNDVYGHSEGDKHIRAAASIIEESFKELGSCYRTGGDEFITVISSEGSEQAVQKAIESMMHRSAEYNQAEDPPVKLQIAHGFAVCSDTANELEKIELLADQRMYECKRKMKQKDSEKTE